MTTKEEGRKKRRVGSESGGRGGKIRGVGRRREREKSTPRRAHCIPRIVRRCNPL